MLKIGSNSEGQNNLKMGHFYFYLSLKQSSFSLSLIRLSMTITCEANNIIIVCPGDKKRRGEPFLLKCL